MALSQAAERIASEFDFPKEHLLRTVKEFIREMDEGLEKRGTTLSQIPSYVTAVPDGTEKVRRQFGQFLFSSKWSRRNFPIDR